MSKGKIDIKIIKKYKSTKLSEYENILDFIEKLKSKDSPMLSKLTQGIHLHTIKCENEEIYNNILNSLRKKGYLL